MTNLELSKDFKMFTEKMTVILEKLNEQYYLVTEKYGNEKAELLLEGFWDSLKKGAAGLNKAAKTVGKAVGTGVKAVSGAKTWLFNKGEIGRAHV